MYICINISLHDNLLVPGDVLHGEAAGLAAPTECYPFNLDEVRLPEIHQLGVVVHFLRVPSFDQGQSVNRK